MISDNGRSAVVQSGRTRPSPQGRATSSSSSSSTTTTTTNDFPNGPAARSSITASSSSSSQPPFSKPQALLLSSVVASSGSEPSDFCVLCAHTSSTTNYQLAGLNFGGSASTLSASSSLGTLDQQPSVQYTPPRRGCDHHTGGGSIYPPYTRAPSDSQVLTKKCPYHHQKVRHTVWKISCNF